MAPGWALHGHTRDAGTPRPSTPGAGRSAGAARWDPSRATRGPGPARSRGSARCGAGPARSPAGQSRRCCRGRGCRLTLPGRRRNVENTQSGDVGAWFPWKRPGDVSAPHPLLSRPELAGDALAASAAAGGAGPRRHGSGGGWGSVATAAGAAVVCLGGGGGGGAGRESAAEPAPAGALPAPVLVLCTFRPRRRLAPTQPLPSLLPGRGTPQPACPAAKIPPRAEGSRLGGGMAESPLASSPSWNERPSTLMAAGHPCSARQKDRVW